MCGDESHEIWTEMLTASSLDAQMEVPLFSGLYLYFQVLPQGTQAAKKKKMLEQPPHSRYLSICLDLQDSLGFPGGSVGQETPAVQERWV